MPLRHQLYQVTTALILLSFFAADVWAQTAAEPLTLEALQSREEGDPQVWRQLAIEARTAGDLKLAAQAIDKAEALGLPPINTGFERARQAAASGNAKAAIAELQALVSAGFTGIVPITGDPELSQLAGDPEFDEMIKGMEAQAYPCAHQERFRAFDFWVGEWDVHLANGTLAGTNTIKPIERGCVLIEEWRTAGGGSGHSINYLDPRTNEWVQVWHAAGGSLIDIRGGMTEEGMRLVGQIHYAANDTVFPFRALWTPLPDGRVRQFFEQSNDNGATWSPWFEGFYSRQAASQP